MLCFSRNIHLSCRQSANDLLIAVDGCSAAPVVVSGRSFFWRRSTLNRRCCTAAPVSAVTAMVPPSNSKEIKTRQKKGIY
ncbi:hypothetical protein Q5P01_010111 [Channa striata]|uniref:Uncharacterized protein n=1 Tax=Channa striata TaxID=64152 RepID=A0AA88MY20_CHASR|nr:hypothetical protein Q5P01_010111 [Channa striata]